MTDLIQHKPRCIDCKRWRNGGFGVTYPTGWCRTWLAIVAPLDHCEGFAPRPQSPIDLNAPSLSPNPQAGPAPGARIPGGLPRSPDTPPRPGTVDA